MWRSAVVGGIIAAAAACAHTADATCVAPTNADDATSKLESALRGGSGWEEESMDFFRCLVPHTFTKGKYSFEDASRLGGSRSESMANCRLLRETARETVRHWIARDVAKRENYVGQYVSLWSTFFLYVVKSATGGSRFSDGNKSRLESIVDACTELHGVPFGKSGDQRGKLDMGLAPWFEGEFREWQRQQSSSSCEPTLKASVEDLSSKILTMKSGDKIVETLGCLVPNTKNQRREGGRIPLEGAQCEKFRDIIAGIAQTIIEKPITRYQSPTDMFSSVVRDKNGAKIVGGSLVALGEMQDACEEKRPYRDWGTTKREISNQVSVTLSIDRDIPEDDEHDDNFRVQMFCVPGTAASHRNVNIRPGQSSRTTIGFDKWEQLEGFSCQLNRGLSGVRMYTINNHATTCVSSNLWVRRLSPKLPYHVIVEPDNCPYRWVLVKEKSTDRHVELALRMKSQAERDGGRLEDVEEESCDSLRSEGVDEIVGKMKAALAKGDSGLYEITKCLVPLKTVGNLRARRDVAKCSLLAEAFSKIAREAYDSGKSRGNGLTVSSVDDPFGAVRSAYDFADDIEIGNHWMACRDPIPRKLWGFNTHHSKGTWFKVETVVAPGVPRDVVPSRFERAPRSCLHGVNIAEQGVFEDRQRLLRLVRSGKASTRSAYIAVKKWEEHSGISCGLPLIQQGNCLDAATLTKYGSGPFFLIKKDFKETIGGSGCAYEYVVTNEGENTVRVTLAKKE